jgi:ABC-type methionine transport system ATPase subunit
MAYYNPAFPILRNVSLEMMPGDKVVLLGASGSGKSTLLSCISGIKIPTQGTVFFNGQPLRYKDDELRHHWRRVPTVDQGTKSLLWFHTIANNIAKTMILNGVPRLRAETDARQFLSEMGLRGKEDAYPQELSGGERQRAVVAKALAMGGELLLADEPISSLDTPIARKILDLLKGLQCGILLVTHQIDLVVDFCDRMFVLHDHRLFDITNVKEERRDLLGNFEEYADLVRESIRLRSEREKAAMQPALPKYDQFAPKRQGRNLRINESEKPASACQCNGVRPPVMRDDNRGEKQSEKQKPHYGSAKKNR